MTKNSLATLKNALREKPAPVAAAAPATAYYKAPSRAGKLHVSAWLSPNYKTSLRAVQMKHPDKNLQSLLMEALNDLFSKYNVPVVREE